MITIKKNPETVGKLKVGTVTGTPADGDVVVANDVGVGKVPSTHQGAAYGPSVQVGQAATLIGAKAANNLFLSSNAVIDSTWKAPNAGKSAQLWLANDTFTFRKESDDSTSGGNIGGWDTVLSISSTGLATFSNGIKTEKGILSGTVLIADDAVTTITPPRKGGFMKLLVDSATAEAGEYPQNIYSGEVFFDCGSSLGIVKCDLSSSLATQLDVSVSNVTGTTGTDGNVTIAVQAGVIKIENRSAGEKRFNYFLNC